MPGCGQHTVLDILGALCDIVARLGTDLHLQRYAPGITGLYLWTPRALRQDSGCLWTVSSAELFHACYQGMDEEACHTLGTRATGGGDLASGKVEPTPSSR